MEWAPDNTGHHHARHIVELAAAHKSGLDVCVAGDGCESRNLAIGGGRPNLSVRCDLPCHNRDLSLHAVRHTFCFCANEARSGRDMNISREELDAKGYRARRKPTLLRSS
jgi:hypothetical protein